MKKPKVEFPVYEPSAENQNHTQSYDPTTSIEDIEEQMDDWLQDRRAPKKKVIDHVLIAHIRCERGPVLVLLNAIQPL